MACTNNCTTVYCTALHCAALHCTALHCIVQGANEYGALTLGGISQWPPYLSSMTKADVQKEFNKEIDVFVAEKMHFQLCEVRIGTQHLNCWQKYLTESCVTVLREHRGDGVANRGVPEGGPACGLHPSYT